MEKIKTPEQQAAQAKAIELGKRIESLPARQQAVLEGFILGLQARQVEKAG